MRRRDPAQDPDHDIVRFPQDPDAPLVPHGRPEKVEPEPQPDPETTTG